MARSGKIARLPAATRDELNQRLRNGEPGSTLLPWLNARPEVTAVLTEFFAGAPVSDSNLSAWRTGGFADWEDKQDRTYKTKELAAFAMKLAAANNASLAEGAAAIVGGELFSVLQAATAEDAKEKLTVDQLREMVSSISSLRGSEIAQQRADQDSLKLKQKDEELKLAREKFQRDTAAMVLESARDTAIQQIAAAPMDHGSQLEAVGKQLFGDLWK